MGKKLKIGEISVVVQAQHHNPTILNPDFLKFNNIIPSDWELASDPVCTMPASQVNYKTGISISALFDKVIFKEMIVDKPANKTQIPYIALKYVKILPHVDYQAVGFNPQGHVQISNGLSLARKALVDTLIAPGPWMHYGQSQIIAEIKLSYSFEWGILNLSVDVSQLRRTNKSVLRFTANCHHDINGNTIDERRRDLHEFINSWRALLKTYNDLVDDFLTQFEV